MTGTPLSSFLRWLGFIPGAFLAATIVRVLNYWGASYVGIDPNDGGLFASVFVAYSDVLEAAALVVAGALIAPSGRSIVAAIIATAQSGIWIMLLFIELSINRILAPETRPGILWILVGSVVGATYVYQEEKKERGLNRGEF